MGQQERLRWSKEPCILVRKIFYYRRLYFGRRIHRLAVDRDQPQTTHINHKTSCWMPQEKSFCPKFVLYSKASNFISITIIWLWITWTCLQDISFPISFVCLVLKALLQASKVELAGFGGLMVVVKVTNLAFCSFHFHEHAFYLKIIGRDLTTNVSIVISILPDNQELNSHPSKNFCFPPQTDRKHYFA